MFFRIIIPTLSNVKNKKKKMDLKNQVRLFLMSYFCPTKWKHSICISDFMQTTFLYLERFLKKLVDDQFSSIPFRKAVSSIYETHIHTTFYHSSDLTRIWGLMEVSTNVLYLQILRFYLVRQIYWWCINACLQKTF